VKDDTLNIYDFLEKDKKTWKKSFKYGGYTITRDIKTGNYTVKHKSERTRKVIGPELVIHMIKQDTIMKYLSESTWTGMGDEPGVSYPDDGSGIAGDDDRPPGNIILGPRFVRKDYFNKLTQYQTIWDYDGKEDFKWDYFENLSGQDDFNNYSDTLKSMEKLFPEDTWKDTWKKMRNVPDKEVVRRFDIAGQPWRSKDDQLGDHPEDQMGGTKTAEVPKELDVQESLNLTDRIDKLLIDGSKILTESKVAKTILKQINAIDKFALPSWDAKNYVSSNDSIQFDVRGSKFRGRVIITYDKRSDTYIIELGQVRGMDWKQKYMVKSIFAQDLVNVLDQQVG
jgi:hypothetical protein